nr:RNA-dependent RNA polymerase [Totiviridae sp.]
MSHPAPTARLQDRGGQSSEALTRGQEIPASYKEREAPFAKAAWALQLPQMFIYWHGFEWYKNLVKCADVVMTPSLVSAMEKRIDEKLAAGEITFQKAMHQRNFLFMRSLLFAPCVIQMYLNTSTLVNMMTWCARMGYKKISDNLRTFKLSSKGELKIDVSQHLTDQMAHRVGLTKEVLRGIFPRKSHPLAGRKANLFLDKLLEDLYDLSRSAYATTRSVIRVMPRNILTDDQFCSALVYAWCMADQVPFATALGYAIFGCLEPVRGKMFSDILKAVGATRHRLGCCLVEVSTLQGRGVGRVDLIADAKLRCGETTHPRVLNADEDKLREAINHVFDMELPERALHLPDVDRFWHERFRWCVAGNHSKAANRHWDREVDYVPPGGRRLTRRICAELQSTNPLHSWSGKVGVSLGEKIEHSKSRAIYSCDTLSYFAFSWILDSVEKCWHSRRVILDPGKDGHLGMYGRIMRMRKRRGMRCFVMADYADFNSQHSLRSQQILFEELLKRTNSAGSELGKKLISSFDNMECYYKGCYLGKVNSTLMSGHRATTFINSVLNAAYCIMAWGREDYGRVESFHVGDDVIVLTNSEQSGWHLVDCLHDLGCELQPSKQSIGCHVFEFLRMAGTERYGARGYLCRAIAGLASGNWVTEMAMEPREGLFSLITQARSIINRSGNEHSFRILISSASRITGVEPSLLHEFLSGAVAVAPGPCYRNDGKYVFRRILQYDDEQLSNRERSTIMRQPLNATYDYIEKGAHLVERLAIEYSGYAPVQAMAIASYGPSRPQQDTGHTSLSQKKLVFGPRESLYLTDKIHTGKITTTEVRHGVLGCFPVAQLLKKALSKETVQSLLLAIGVEAPLNEVMSVAWGEEHDGSVIIGVLPYSDAAGIAARHSKGTVIVDRPIAL